MREIKQRVEQKKPTKRDNPNRGKHGCARLHAMRAEGDNNAIVSVDVPEQIISDIPSTKQSFLSTIKNKLFKRRSSNAKSNS